MNSVAVVLGSSSAGSENTSMSRPETPPGFATTCQKGFANRYRLSILLAAANASRSMPPTIALFAGRWRSAPTGSPITRWGCYSIDAFNRRVEEISDTAFGDDKDGL